MLKESTGGKIPPVPNHSLSGSKTPLKIDENLDQNQAIFTDQNSSNYSEDFFDEKVGENDDPETNSLKRLKSGKVSKGLTLCYDYESNSYVLLNSNNQTKKVVRFLSGTSAKNLIAENLSFKTITDQLLLKLPKFMLSYDPKLDFGEIRGSKLEQGFRVFNTHYEPNFYNTKSVDNYSIPKPLKLLLTNIFEDKKGVEHGLNWLANMIQRNKNETSILFYGTQGSGKGTFFELVKRLIGFSNVGIIENTTLESAFNEELMNKRLLAFNELNTYGKNQHINNKLKTFITDTYLNIFVKNKTPFTVENYSSVIIATNSDNAVKISYEDRRFSVFQHTKKLEDIETGLGSKIANLTDQEILEFKQFLFNRDLSQYDHRKPFENISRRKMMENTATKKESLIYLIKSNDLTELRNDIFGVYKDEGRKLSALSNDDHIQTLIKRTGFESVPIKELYTEFNRDLELLVLKSFLTSRLASMIYREVTEEYKASTQSIGRFYRKSFGDSALIKRDGKPIRGFRVQ